MITYNPAKIMGIEKQKGSIVIGKDADIIIFDNNINVTKVYIGDKLLIDNNK